MQLAGRCCRRRRVACTSSDHLRGRRISLRILIAEAECVSYGWMDGWMDGQKCECEAPVCEHAAGQCCQFQLISAVPAGDHA